MEAMIILVKLGSLLDSSDYKKDRFLGIIEIAHAAFQGSKSETMSVGQMEQIRVCPLAMPLHRTKADLSEGEVVGHEDMPWSRSKLNQLGPRFYH